MIKIQIVEKLFSEKKIVYINVSGHSNYAEKGSDIVCAGVSSVFTVVASNIDESNFEVELRDGFGSIKCKKEPSDRDNFLMNCFKDYIQDVVKQYAKYVSLDIESL